MQSESMLRTNRVHHFWGRGYTLVVKQGFHLITSLQIAYMYYECGAILIDLSWHQLQILWKPYFVTFDYVNIIMINNQATP